MRRNDLVGGMLRMGILLAGLSVNCQGGEPPNTEMMPMEDPKAGDPAFVNFTTDAAQLTQGQSLRFTATLTDPAGLANLRGGELKSADGKITYGSFVLTQPGSYSIELSWDQINQAAALNFAGEQTQSFLGEFQNASGGRVSQSLAVRLYCADNRVSSQGVCKDGCYFGNTYYSVDEKNSQNACQVCLPQRQLTDWTALSDGASCGAGLECMQGACVPMFSTQTSGTTQNLLGIWGSSKDEVYVVGAGGTILRTADSGASWTIQQSGTTRDLNAIWGSPAHDIFAVGAEGTVLLTSDSGATWKSLDNPYAGMRSYRGVWGSASDDIYVIGAEGTILRTTDSGTTFSEQTSGTTAFLRAIWGSSTSDIYVVGDAGTILHSADSGTTWVKQTSGVDSQLLAVWGKGGNDVYAAGVDGVILHSVNGGVDWVKQTSGASTTRTAVWGSGSNDVYCVGSGLPTILHSTDGGTSWQSLQTASSMTFNAVWGSSADDVYFIGDAGAILHRP